MGKLGDMLKSYSDNGVIKKASPAKLEVHAHISHPMDAVAMNMNESKFLKQDRQRLVKEIKEIKKILDNWIPEDVAERAKKSLEKQLSDRESDLEVCKLRLSHEDSESDEESDEEPEEAE